MRLAYNQAWMSRRQRTAPKASISPSVRLGLTSIVAGNEAGIRTMLSAAASDDLVEKLAKPHVKHRVSPLAVDWPQA